MSKAMQAKAAGGPATVNGPQVGDVGFGTVLKPTTTTKSNRAFVDSLAPKK